MLHTKNGKSPQLLQWAAAGLVAASLTACSAAGLVSQVKSSISSASNPKPVALQITATAPAVTATSAAQAPVTTSQDQLYEDLYAKSNPSVVNITGVIGAAQGTTGGGRGQGQPGQGVGVALGSGFVYDSQGDIITNNHVVAGATKITVTFADGVESAATVVGASPDADLAVIKVTVAANELHPLKLGASDALKVGVGVVANDVLMIPLEG